MVPETLPFPRLGSVRMRLLELAAVQNELAPTQTSSLSRLRESNVLERIKSRHGQASRNPHQFVGPPFGGAYVIIGQLLFVVDADRLEGQFAEQGLQVFLDLIVGLPQRLPELQLSALAWWLSC